MTICSTPVGAGYSLFSVLQKVSHFFCAVKRSRAYFAVVYKFLLQIYIFFCPESAAVGIGELISCTVLGVLLVKIIESNTALKKIFE